MKKVFALALAVLMVLSLAACSSSSEGEENSAPTFDDVTDMAKELLAAEDLISDYKVEGINEELVDVKICLKGLNEDWAWSMAELIFLEDEDAIKTKEAVDWFVSDVNARVKKLYADNGYPDVSITVMAFADDGKYENMLLWIQDDEVTYDNVEYVLEIANAQFALKYHDLLGE